MMIIIIMIMIIIIIIIVVIITIMITRTTTIGLLLVRWVATEGKKGFKQDERTRCGTAKEPGSC